MLAFEWIIGLLLGAMVLSALARHLRVPYPTFLALGGVALAFIPGVPNWTLEPDLALALLVAPVLLDAAFDTSLRDLRANWLSVSTLVLIAVALTYTGGLQGTGDTKSPLYISIVSQLVLPLSICFVIRRTGTLDPIDIWMAILVGHATRCALSVLRFNQGKWRHIAVDLEEA